MAGVLVVVAGAIVLLWIAAHWWRDDAFYVSGDALEVVLLGVRPDETDDLYGPSGLRVGERPDRSGSLLSGFGSNHVQRDFVFQLPELPDDFRMVNTSIRRAGTTRNVREGVRRETTNPHLNEYVLRTLIEKAQEESGLFGRIRNVPVERVDVTLSYYHGSRGGAEATFSGPWKPGVAMVDDEGRGYELTVRAIEGADEAALRITLRVPRQIRYQPPLILYRDDGDWLLPDRTGWRLSASDTEMEYQQAGVSIDQVRRLAFNEPPRERTFHNVRIVYADVPPRERPPWMEEMLRRNRNVDLTVRPFKSRDEALAVIDLVRGWQVAEAWRALRGAAAETQPDELAADDRERLREAAWIWAHSSEDSVQLTGVLAGLWLGDERFVALAEHMPPSTNARYADQPQRALAEYRQRRQ